MRISGFQKCSLIDYPGKICAIVFTAGCNFNCPWCHNPELVNPSEFPDHIEISDILTFLKKRRGKLDGITITGGEPLLHADVSDLIQEIKQLGFLIKLDTNGSFPEQLERIIRLKSADYIAMDIKAPLHRYEFITQTAINTHKIKESIRLIRQSDIKHEFRTTFIPELLDEEDIVTIRSYLSAEDPYYIQPFQNEKLLDNTLKSLQPVSEIRWNQIKKLVSGAFFRD